MSTETRRNKTPNPITPLNTSIALWAPVRGTAALNGDSLRLTINDATVALAAQRITPSTGITTIAAKPNTTYTISSDFRTNSAAGGAITAQFYDPGSVLIGSLTSTITPALNSSTFVRGSHTFTTPPNTAYILVNIGSGSGPRNIGEWYDFRQVLIEESPVATTYFDGDTPNTSLFSYEWTGAVNGSESFELSLVRGIRRNKASNPSNEIAGGWANSNAAVYTVTDDATIAYVGTKSRKSVPIGAGIGVANGVIMSLFNVGNLAPFVIPNKQYTASMYVRQNVAAGVDTPSAQIGWVFLDSGQVAIGGVTYSSNVFPVQNIWTRISVITSAAPSNAVYLRIYCVVKHINNVITDVNDAAWADAILIEEDSTLLTYFDGNTPDANDGGVRYYYTGALDNSESIEETFAVVRRNKAIDPHLITAAGWGGSVITGGAITGTQVYSPNFLSVPGEVWTVSCDCIAPAGSAFSGTLSMSPTTGAAFGSNTRVPTSFNVPAGTTQRISNTYTVNVGADGFRMLLNSMSPIDGTAKIDRILIEKTGSVQPYFDGSFPAANGFEYLWIGTPDSSESIAVNTLPETRRNLAPNPSVYAGGYGYAVNAGGGAATTSIADVTGSGPAGVRSYKGTWTALATADVGGIYHGNGALRQILVYPGQIISGSMWVRANRTQRIFLGWYAYDTTNTLKGNGSGAPVVLNPNEWTLISFSNARMPALADHLIVAAYSVLGTGFARWNVNDTFEVQGVLVENSDTVNPYFDGDSSAAGTITYAWSYTKGQSESIAYAASGGSKGDTIYAGLVAGGYGPGSMADMEYRRLLAKNGLAAPQKLTLSDLYSLAGERPRIGAFRK
jgi:hypothetical protein